MPDPRDIYAAKEEALEADALEHAYGVLLSNCEGLLCFDDAEIQIKFVFDHADGRLIASIPIALTLAGENILHIPEFTDDALHLLIAPELIEESTLTDRWQAYHGQPEHVRWAAYWIDSAKHGPWVFDGDALMRLNALEKHQADLCKQLNADQDALRAMCLAHAHVDVESPMAVGVDPLGIHIRARFGIVRIRFEELATNAEHAHKMIEQRMS